MKQYRSFKYELLEELGEEHALGCQCCRFNKGVDLPVPRELSVQETTRAARAFSAAIFKDWTKLNAIFKRFESTIRKRWMKKSLKQRRELLLRAWPDMSSTHRPDFEFVRKTHKQTSRSATCASEAYIWPYINLEDLQQRHLLLLFLNSRARNVPNTFRTADVKAAHLGPGWTADLDIAEEVNDYCCKEHFFEDVGCKEHCMLFQEKFSPNGYGQVIHGSGSKLKGDQLKHIMRSSEGLLTLEIQTTIYRFLISSVKLILHDIEPSKFFLAPSQPAPEMPTSSGEAWNSLSNHSLEAPYRVPYGLDLERLKILFESRRTSAEDHIWLLREDPAYFMDTLREWKEHSGIEKICSCDSCWNREVGRMIMNAFDMFVFFDDIWRKLCTMAPVDKQLKRANEAKVRLSTSDENQWTALVELVYHAIYIPMDLLYDGLPTSPRLRGRYRNTGTPDKQQWQMKSKSSEAEYRVDRLFFALFREDQRELHGWSGLVQEIQYMLDTDANASQYVDSWITTQFSDLALLVELNKSVDALAPYFDQIKAHTLMACRPVALDKAIDRTRSAIIRISASIKDVCDSSDLCWDPSNSKADFHYPADKRPTKANVEQMREAEQRLDMLWWTLEEEVKDMSKLSLRKVLESRSLHPREIHRTKPWKEPVQLATPNLTPRKQVLGELDPNVGRFHENSSPTGSVTPVKAAKEKEKVKTRGTPAATDPRSPNYRGPAEQLPTPPSTPSKPEQRFKVSRKVFKVLCALLPSPSSVVEQRCEIAWDELLTAMHAIGLIPMKLYGSVWIFSPADEELRKCDAQRSIQFHEPKEVRRGQKIPRPMVRTYGRRLKHAFGWEAAEDLFECG